jgi:hypothetical protein
MARDIAAVRLGAARPGTAARSDLSGVILGRSEAAHIESSRPPTARAGSEPMGTPRKLAQGLALTKIDILPI